MTTTPLLLRRESVGSYPTRQLLFRRLRGTPIGTCTPTVAAASEASATKLNSALIVNAGQSQEMFTLNWQRDCPQDEIVCFDVCLINGLPENWHVSRYLMA